MTYYSGSLLQVEWTAQHACGADHPKADCDIILQYMCHPELRDGLTTDTITAETASEKEIDPKTGEETWKYGMHESAEYFEKCKERQRNGTLRIILAICSRLVLWLPLWTELNHFSWSLYRRSKHP